MRYRPNVAALMLDPDGLLLVCERWNLRGSWQFPQGGVDSGEKKKEALFREVREEIGLRPEHYEIIDRRSGYRYLYPPHVRWKKLRKHGNHGQEQTYYLCRVLKGAPEVDVDQDPPEFQSHRWIRPEEFRIEWLPHFKQPVYRQVMADFFSVAI